MANIVTNGIHIEYDSFGESSNPPLLLIAGLGMQLVGWDVRFCSGLADTGFYVIRFDNSDLLR